MLHRLYRGLLRLHPPAFRKRFGEEMLSIFEQSNGRWTALRLTTDAAVSLLRQWAFRPDFWNENPAPAEQPAFDGIPSFSTLAPFRPRASAVLPGLLLSVAVFSLTCAAIKYSGFRVPIIRVPEVPFEAQQWVPQTSAPSNFPEAASQSVPQERSNTASADIKPAASRPVPKPPARATSAPKTGTNISQRPEAASLIPPEIAATQTKGEVATSQPSLSGAASRASYEQTPLDAATRHRVIDSTIANLSKYYVDAGVAQRMSSALRMHEKNGDDSEIKDGTALAEALTGQMRAVSHDKYLEMVYSTAETAQVRPAPTAEDITQYQKEMQRRNCTFEKVEILPHNIGYLKLNSFPDASICGSTAKAAMAKLNNADAIILDLRDNPGGYANMVALLATYLFDRPTHLNDFYNRGENSREESWTLPPIPGNKLANKPVFILTSHTTFSAAEGFSYDLKILKRATLVGETTSGRGHMGAEHRIDDHFTIRIPEVKVTNPITGTNWEGTGVEPDVNVKAMDALTTAIRLAKAKVRK